jgi:hypothetical protein
LLVGDFQGAGRRLEIQLAVKLLKLLLQAGLVIHPLRQTKKNIFPHRQIGE